MSLRYKYRKELNLQVDLVDTAKVAIFKEANLAVYKGHFKTYVLSIKSVFNYSLITQIKKYDLL